MARIFVKSGDDLSTLAAEHGYPSWRSIYDFSENHSYWETCKNPDVLQHGSELTVPKIQHGTHPVINERQSVFKLKRENLRLRLRIEDQYGEPHCLCPFWLELMDRAAIEGKTDRDGFLDQMLLPTDGKGVLIVSVPCLVDVDGTGREDVRYELQFGALEPVNCVSGQQARLNNLGFESGEVDGIFGPITRGAIKRFQKSVSIDDDGIVGPITSGELVLAHGS